MSGVHHASSFEDEVDFSPVERDEGLSLVTQLSRACWSLSGRPLPSYDRSSVPVAFVPRTRK